jgi:hypothetical protein
LICFRAKRPQLPVRSSKVAKIGRVCCRPLGHGEPQNYVLLNNKLDTKGDTGVRYANLQNVVIKGFSRILFIQCKGSGLSKMSLSASL